MRALALLCVIATLWYAVDAFSSTDTSTRVVSATVTSDSSAYLALSTNVAGPHAAFVTEGASDGLLVVSFAHPSGVTGQGVNAGAGYYFHDLLKVTNQGNATVFVQAVASGSPGRLDVCVAASPASMTRGCYGATSPATATSLAVGATAYVGLHANATGVSASNTIAGTVRVLACRSAAATCSNG